MALEKYREKRRFEKTPEPPGRVEPRRGDLRFVVQKHQASRLHYDFRLELDGVLKSWAVPKGPSLDPADKRLALMVEDHPLEYRTFEGIIPAGNYGAGTVMVWDEGTYEPADPGDAVATLRHGLTKGHLRFTLHGKKLRGQFSLVKIKKDEGNAWLLFKHADAFATQEDVRELDRSVVSKRGLEQIAAQANGRGEVWQSNRAAAAPRNRRARILHAPTRPVKARLAVSRGNAPMPHNVKPMLATMAGEPFDKEGWLFEIKWDGYRAIAEIEHGRVRLYSRNSLSFETKFPPVVDELRRLGHDAVLDGEIVVFDDEGKPQFQLVQSYQKTGKGALAYVVFDLLYLDGQDLRRLPLVERKDRLADLVKKLSSVHLSEHIETTGRAFFEAARARGLEGIVAKNGKSPYQEGQRGPHWLKIKIRRQQEAVIGGFTRPRGSRTAFGALVLGIYEGDDLVYVGHTGSGFDQKGLIAMHERLAPLVQKACPFREKPKTNAPVQWVEPRYVCEVAFQEWTEDGSMRHPIYLGLREDKSPREVRRELPQATHAAPTSRATRAAKHPAAEAKFTNLDKVYWPEDGFTKGDLIAYYKELAPVMVPHLKDRPLSMNRHPNGIHGPNFFQKNTSDQNLPPFIETTMVASDTHDTIQYLMVQNEATLLYVANLGCIEINPWNSRLPKLDYPDYLVIDLDPQDVTFPQVVEAAQKVHKLLEKRCSESYCKTSGKRGLHIYVPLGARYDYDQTKQFAELIAHIVHKTLPRTTSVLRNPAQRRNKIYLDFLQNRRGQTMAAPYSVRPIEGARVSTPLRWQEVTKRLDPARFTIKTVPKRIDKFGDLWQPVLGKGVDLEKCLRTLVDKT